MQRRAGTLPKKIRMTHEGHALIQAWAEQNGVSFSAAIELLARLGLGQAGDTALAPALVSTVRREVASTMDRVIRLLLYNITESGVAARMAGATYFAVTPDKARYDALKTKVRMDARRSLATGRIGAIIAELEEAVRGDREGELPAES